LVGVIIGKRTLQGVLDDGNNTLKLLRSEVTSALAQINIGLLADQVGVTTTDTLDLGQGVHNLLLAIDVGVKQTNDVLEVGLLAGYERCKSSIKLATADCNIFRSVPDMPWLLCDLFLVLSVFLATADPPSPTSDCSRPGIK